MNLLSNAAEAMPDGGSVFVSTENRYVDLPIKGYDEVKPGDYVVIKVTDTGVGISQEDMERIFEPFYTKKVMGRSGTGLGMAVVWGTVKDHRGYIDVRSIEGQGTSFTLYLPVTLEARETPKQDLALDDLMGHGELIAVVDDVEDQRTIASGMLNKLGYKVETFASGEQLIHSLKEMTFDLVVLDMIMDPGIDGLETYQQILAYHPGQKAVIASGFSETDHVKEAQQLGAGRYVKKPYTIEKIGLAVKKELAK
jgi:CheY-like chemotaxis protein